MLISLNWIKQHLTSDYEFDISELREKITNSLAEVENIYNIAEGLKEILVGQIKGIEPIEGSDHLQKVIVDIGNEKIQVVCGAKNIFNNALVPVVKVGGQVYNPKEKLFDQSLVKIREVKLKNVLSSGMICSQKELGISDNHEEIWILSNELKIGEDISSQLKDTIFEIENKSITHRPDCFSHLGIAKEISAIYKIPLKNLDFNFPITKTANLDLNVKILDNELCKRYTAIVISGINNTQSPFWLQNRLLSIGVKPQNIIVDTTNYIMFDIGQPLHAFDYDKINNKQIIVRKAKQNEKIITLDNIERKLDNANLLITDKKRPVAIAGILGGFESKITNETKNIVIESANFEMFNNRRTSRYHGIRTEAGIRFEKGLDPNLTLEGLKQATQIIVDQTQAEIASNIIDIYPNPIVEETIIFDIVETQRLLGIEISKEKIFEILELLGFKVESLSNSDTKINITIPTRRRDIHIKEDILEEILRIYGYNNVKPELPTKPVKAVKTNPFKIFEIKIKQILSSLGLDEIYTYSFIGQEFLDKSNISDTNFIKLKNPISPELSILRKSLVPSLLDKILLNEQNFDNFGIFEISRIYLKEKDENNLPKQPKRLSMLFVRTQNEDESFFICKGLVDELLHNLNILNYNYKKIVGTEFFHKNKCASISIEKNEIGLIGVLDPIVKQNWKIKSHVVIVDIDLEKLFSYFNIDPKYKQIIKFPKVIRDISFWVEKNYEVGKIIKEISKAKIKFLKSASIKEVYFDKTNSSKKSITININLQSKTHTLIDNEINEAIKELITRVEKTGANIRK